MPIYEYRCTKGHAFEAFQSMADDPITECVECGAAAERVLSAPAIHYKGSGFYTTDYARKGKKGAAANGSSSEGAKSSEKSSSGSGNSSPGSSEKKSSSGSSSSD